MLDCMLLLDSAPRFGLRQGGFEIARTREGIVSLGCPLSLCDVNDF